MGSKNTRTFSLKSGMSSVILCVCLVCRLSMRGVRVRCGGVCFVVVVDVAVCVDCVVERDRRGLCVRAGVAPGADGVDGADGVEGVEGVE